MNSIYLALTIFGIMLVLMADQVSTPVGDLFMGALVPGVALGLLYMFFILALGLSDHHVGLTESRQSRVPCWRSFLSRVSFSSRSKLIIYLFCAHYL